MGIGAALGCQDWGLPMAAFLEALITMARRTGNKAMVAFTTAAAMVVMVTVWYATFRAA